MKDPGTLLSTLTQATAVFVAIVGGFLVSRLVAISTERDGLKRRYKQTRDQLEHVAATYQEAHEYRLWNSQRTFRGWVLSDLVDDPPESVDRDKLLSSIPRGSSRDEMATYLDELIRRVNEVRDEIGLALVEGDTNLLVLRALEERGLDVSDHEREIYERVVDSVASELPRPAGNFVDIPRIGHIVSPAVLATELRRLDESISQEQELAARAHILDSEAERLRTEIALTGRLVGVTPAVLILGLYSLAGIVAPVVVLTIHPMSLAAWASWVLVALFIAGLAAVLGYILWYAGTLNNAAVDDGDE